MTQQLPDAAAQVQVHDLAELRRQYEIDDGDLDRIRAFGSIVVPKLGEFIRRFYEWMETLPEYEEFFQDGAVEEHVKEMLVDYWERFFSASLDEAYVEERVRVGEVHARIGLSMPLYLRSMDKAFRILTQDLYDDSLGPDTYTAALHSIVKLVHLDTTFVLDVNLRLVNDAAMAQSRTLMEMSTPVTQVWGGVLFLPLVGSVDAARAQEIMDVTLPAIRDAKARALIMDISGVPVVDADVAAYLVKVSRAASLMGCECITSGVSPAIAHTIVDLGIDVGQLTTTANLRGAITDAYARRGLRVAAEG